MTRRAPWRILVPPGGVLRALSPGGFAVRTKFVVVGVVVVAGAVAAWVGRDAGAQPGGPAPARGGVATLDDLMDWRKAEWTENQITYAVQARAGRQLRAAGPRYFVQLECQDLRKTWVRLHPDDAAGLADFCDQPVGGLPDEALKGEAALKVRTWTVADAFDPRTTLWVDYLVEGRKFENNRVGAAEFSFNPKAYATALRAALKDVEAIKKYPAHR